MKINTYFPVLFLFFALSNPVFSQSLVINEIMTSNSNSIKDEDNSYQDWIELYNSGPTSVNLLGFGLSDDPLVLYKWTFPNVSLASGQYLIVWASDKNKTLVGGQLHTNFKISSTGETILLTNTSGVTISTVPPVNLQTDISYGKYPNGTGPYAYFGTPTPNAANLSAGFSEILNPPVFSQASGFLTSGFSLTLSSPDPGTTILYTLDGSEPDENNLSGTTYNYKNQYPKLPGQAFGPFLYNSFQTLQYTAPIPVADRSSQPNKLSAMSTTYDFTPPYFPNGPIYKGNIIRAKVIKPGALPSKVVSRNYFITPSGSTKYSLPVLSLSFDENDLYDYEDGIAVAGIDFDNWRIANPTKIPSREIGNFERDGIANERKANMHYFVNGQEKINQDVGIRIRGAFSRTYPSKSWNIAARSDFGDDNLSYKFFSDEPYTSYERLSAKSGGSDFYNTMFRDALNHQLVKDLRMETESFQPMVVFMNGEYWGLLNMREKYDNNYFKQVYNIDEVDLLENQGAVQEGDAVDYNNMYSYISNNSFTSDANYAYIQTRMDTDNFIDYFVTNIFAQNDDWPGNNIVYWRKRTTGFVANAPYGHDGRWRWAIHDMDSTLDEPDHDSLADATSTTGTSPNPPWSTLILRKLLENNTFKNDFINRFADLMNTNFLSSRVIAKQNEIAAIIAPEMPDQYFRWKAPLNNGDWQYHLNKQKDFANQRPAFQRDDIRTKFGISSNINASLNVSNYDHGYIKISTIDIKDGTPGISGNPYPWTGIYFKGIPLKLKAIAKPGYVFSNWSGASTSTDPEITITPNGNFSITAVFVPVITENIVPIYFWMMNGSIVNGAQLTSLNSTYELATDGVIQYQSCLSGYPYPSGNPNYGKASMERRNNPTSLNYRPEVNSNLTYASSDMRGLQIKQPFQNGGRENTLYYNFSTAGYKKIKFSFAAVDEGAANAILIDYSVNSGTPVWINSGLATSSLSLSSSYQLFTIDFSSITMVDDNPNFKIRFRFTGSNMTADTGARVTFNNIAVEGVKLPLSYKSPNIFTVGTAITNLVPSTTEIVSSYSVSPSLPVGLSLNTSTGVISGTPTVASSTSIYTVNGVYGSGSLSYGISIFVNDLPPNNLSYTSPNVFTKDVAIAPLSPSVSGGAVVSYSIAPALPLGLSFDTASGVISGTPSVISGSSTYTVTAVNSGGSTSFGIVITVNDSAPSSLSYTSPNVFTKNVAIASLSPSVSGGAVVSYSIAPALPVGLSFDTASGVISGTPTSIVGTDNYTVTATNSGGSTSFGIVITVNDSAPSSLSYTSPNVFTKNVAIAPLSPSVSGGAVVSYSIAPALPVGLSFDTVSGVISGTPSVISGSSTYTVTATNSGGSTSFGIVITINDVAPSSLSYNSPNVFTKDVAIAPLSPAVSGGVVVSYSIAPALPFGLSFDTVSGVISGTPSVISGSSTYTVTATNSGGSTSFGIVVTVNDSAPSSLSYTSPNVFTKNVAITPLSPTVSGGSVVSYSIAPALPFGLSFDTVSGVISGTPSVISGSSTYTVTATNSGGSTSFGIVVTVNDSAPSSLSYTSPNVFTKNIAITPLSPSVSGGAVVSYSIAPALPFGLNFDTVSGLISGTPSVVSGSSTYTVTAVNSGGSTSFGIVITVNDSAPSSLSYASPNVFTKDVAIAPLNPSVSGGAVVSYSITPALPVGLSFDTASGVISGTPSVIRSSATYTVTAVNSGGSISFGVVITVNDSAPSSLSYTSPNVFTKNVGVTPLSPSVSGGVVVSYSVSPTLPLGLSFDTVSGVISGTPLVISGSSTYTVTAVNSGGSTSFGILITVNDSAPSSLSYASPNVFTKDVAIAPLNPSVSGGAVVSYSITPALPVGLSFDTASGVISGTPSVIRSSATYTVTAVNSGGATSFGVVITVNDSAPSSLSYISPNVFTKDVAIPPLSPSVSGGAVVSYSIAPALPLGLSLNTTTGIISGTPLVIRSSATYTVTATNSGGSTSFGVIITVNDSAPSALSYNSPNVFTKDVAIAPLNPSVSGGAVVSYSITPTLPLGLNFDTASGVISGTPSVISSSATYTVTATNTGGATSFGIVITVNDSAPSALSYNSPNVFTKDVAIAPLNPSVSGGAVVSYSITPTLPLGLSFDTALGVISGTPSVISGSSTYTVTATNSGGSTSFGIVVTVNDSAPSSLSYTSPNVFTKNIAITPLSPSVSGGAVVSYSIAPALPFGLNFDTVSGLISGTPSVVSGSSTYTVTASNSGGSTSFGVVIAVNDSVPTLLSYTSPNVFTKDVVIAPLSPTVFGGEVVSYSIAPALPLGLSFDTASGVISGTPSVIYGSSIYTVTATNSGGSTSFGVVITVNDSAPSSLSYTSPNVFTKDVAITPLSPTVSGGAVVSYSIAPALPLGLSFDTISGVISGTPSVISSSAMYTVTATNTGGATSFGIVITVNDVAPSALSYPSPNVLTKGVAITPLSPSVSGGAVVSYSIAPALPVGLSFDTVSGVISGTPSVIAGSSTYTVTAVNSGGATSFGVVITVNDSAPSSLSYPSPNVLTKGVAIAPLSPSVSGGAVLSYSIAPALPLGLNFDTVSGVISGTPSVIAGSSTFTVTAVNSGGSTSFGVVITVNDVAPSALSYTSPNVFTKGVAITPLSPSVSGGAVVSYSITPALPVGLSFDTVSGVISGTPSVIAGSSTYTITAVNSGGYTSFGVVITVNDVAPSALSYTSANVFTKGVAITPLSPSVSGGAVMSYSVSPALPVGLSLNAVSGVISGTPSVISSSAMYTVTATNSGGSTSFGIVITVNDVAPSALSYPSPNVLTRGTTITNINPQVFGGEVINYTITPNLPTGLYINTLSGVISGTPLVISEETLYKITASNSGGSTFFDLNITVNDVAPNTLSYASPNIFTKGIDISNLTPFILGDVDSYSISPTLPSGLSFDTISGIISGTPSVITGSSTYTVTAVNSGGSTSFEVVITVNDVAPSALSYTSPNVFTKDVAIAPLSPAVSGGAVVSYSIAPALPLGLSFDTASGVISGTPSVIAGSSAYTVTAVNSGGATSFGVVITVNDVAPSALSYTSPNVFTKDVAITPLSPSVSGGAVLSYSITPALPLGLSLNAVNGVISGTPSVIAGSSAYTVTAVNSGGATSFGIVITVNDVAPSALSYPSPNVLTKGVAITPLNPSVSGGAVLNYSIAPALPLGLSFDTISGMISGTPSVIAGSSAFTVTAVNSGGSTSFGVVITVNDSAPSSLSYPSPNVLTKGVAITPLSPSVSGGAVVNYSIAPALPLGLDFDTASGVISGTPSVIAGSSTYTVTAVNSGGATSFGVVITVNDVAPSALSYTSPNVFTKDVAITPLSPSVSGGAVMSYSVSPALPLGLDFDTVSGVISGTPSVISSSAMYTVTATNSGGSTSFGIVITVNDVATSALSYTSPNVFTKDVAITPLSPSVSGGAVLSYSITPALPLGLDFDTVSGVISGTPSVISSSAMYTVTATNSGGSTSFGIVITVNDVAPSALSYTSPNVFTKDVAIAPLSPSVSGGAVVSYSIAPALPLGLSFDTVSGVISGTPSVIAGSSTYTVTAVNSGGATSFGVVITVNDVAPSALSYTSPNVFTKDVAITPLSPSVSGGAVMSYSVSPALPLGLDFDTVSGVISGTPSVISSSAMYTVTATNSGGSTSFGIVITVNDVATSALSYTSPNVFTKDVAITPLSPSVSGGAVLSYSITPALPLGLSFDTISGMISGTPSVIAGSSAYTVTAVNSGGATSFGIVIIVNDSAPNSLSYASPNVFTKGVAITPLSPSVSGGAVVSYSITPALPLGLDFDTVSGMISGTPTVISSSATYTITATNSGGSTSFGIVITVNDVAPSALSYPSPNVLTKNSAIIPLLPSVSGGAVLSYSITPALPLGLSFDTISGMIWGTPSVISGSSTYTVTASNSGGSTSFGIVITVNDVAPSALSYTSPNVFTKGVAITPLSPSVSGGAVLSYSIAPALPLGLNFDTVSGVISGTPSVISSSAMYTVTATNSGGATSFGIVITVNDVAPSALSYPSPNMLTKGVAITPLSPSVSGGAVMSYSIAPALPLGLSFDTASGVISGTPAVIAGSSAYTVTALNSGGATSFDVIITIENTLTTIENLFSKIKVYPNPFNDILYVSGIAEIISYEMYNTEGKLIQKGITNNSKIAFSNLPSGMYILKLFSDYRMVTKKIIKQ